MLYISRYVGFDSYGVVDTDDNIETVVKLDDIKTAVLRLGIPIRGVEVIRAVRKGMRLHLGDVLAYQDVSQCTRLQTKTSMLSCVDIVTWGNMITNIRWRANDIKEPVSIRLSDFGIVLGDRILYGNRECTRHCITLVFDDKVKVDYRSLECHGACGSHRVIGSLGLGLKLDFREITEEDLVEKLYLSLFSDPLDLGLFDSMADDIIDDPARKKYMVGLRNW